VSSVEQLSLAVARWSISRHWGELHDGTRRSTLVNDDKVYDEPSGVEAEKGEVAVKGPDQVDVRLTPEAAEETSDRLLEGAMIATGKRRLEKLPHRPK
jgi:hypothetical protein